MKIRHFGRTMLAESRGSRGRLTFFIACLAIGVAAVVAVAGLVSGLDSAIRGEARQLLAADLALESRRPLPDSVEELLHARPGYELAAVKELVTVVAVPAINGKAGRSQLVELKAVSRGYPFYGRLEAKPPLPLEELLSPTGAVVAGDLLARLGLVVGDELAIGGARFTLAGEVIAEPDRLGDAFSLGPRVFLSIEGLARTDLERFGSRIEHKLLVRVPDIFGTGDLEALAAELRDRAEGAYRVETWAESQPSLRDGLERVNRFLGLVALLSLLLGGLGVAQTTSAWLAGRVDAMAILRSLGFRPREVLALYLGQTLVLGLLGSLVGIVAGLALQQAVPLLLADLLPPGIRPGFWSADAAVRGLALGLGTALLFSLSPLLVIGRVPPLRVLRKDVEPLPASWPTRLALGLTLALGIGAAASAQSGSLRRGLLFTAAVALAAGLLYLTALALVRLASALPRRRGRVWLRQGLAALARPGAPTLGAVVALGLGVLLLVGMSLVERTLSGELTPSPDLRPPSAFFIDIQPDQWEGTREILERNGATAVESVPVVTARLTAIDGRSVAEMTGSDEVSRNRRWALGREQRLTTMEELPEDNRVIAGALWSEPEADEVSVERDFARDLGVDLGSALTFDIQGVEVDLRVTSLRSVDWGTFDINFFLVAEPGALAGAPGFRLATARLPPAAEQRVQDRLAAAYPNVTMFRIAQVLDTIRGVLARLAAGVRFLGAFTLLAGIAILAGAVSASSVRRGREIALLKTLGMTRRSVAAAFAIEHALLGLVAGVLGAAGGLLLGWAVVTRGMELAWRLDPLPPVIAIVASATLASLTGVLAGARALRQRPAVALRGD